tara:strand:- start:53 stop:679 length:627 start_codon:yes stop_codon:yes gene_type:complete
MTSKAIKGYKFIVGGKNRPGIVGVKPKSGGAVDEYKSRKLKSMGKRMRGLKSGDKEIGETIKRAQKRGVARKNLVEGRKVQRDGRRLQREGDKLRKDILRIGKAKGGAIRVKHPKGHPDTKVKKGDDYKGKTLKQKKKSAQRFADTVQTKMSEKRSKTEGSFAKGGSALKPVDKQKNPGLAKLPTHVRNKMGYMKKGGRVRKFGGGKK